MIEDNDIRLNETFFYMSDERENASNPLRHDLYWRN
jgi:hypothetical protein